MSRPIRPIRIEGNIAYVTLTKGYEAVIDAEDVSLVSENNWTAIPSGNTAYAVRRSILGGKKSVRTMHRLIIGDPKGLLVDHINGNGLDNRKENLRTATKSQNMHNATIRKDNKTGYKGVSWDKAAKKYRAEIRIFRKGIFLGLFECPKEASLAYIEACKRYHKEYAKWD